MELDKKEILRLSIAGLGATSCGWLGANVAAMYRSKSKIAPIVGASIGILLGGYAMYKASDRIVDKLLDS